MPTLAGLTANRNRQAAHGLDHHADEHWSRRAFCATDPEAWHVRSNNSARGARIATARHGCLRHCPVLEQCRRNPVEVRGGVLAGTYYNDDGKVSDWQPSTPSCVVCRPGGA